MYDLDTLGEDPALMIHSDIWLNHFHSDLSLEILVRMQIRMFFLQHFF